MSATARRFFGCVLPVTLAVFGCGALLLVGYAGQIVFQLVSIDDRAMEPVLEPGWTVVVNNTAFWAQRPLRGSIVSLAGNGSVVLRRLYGLPGDTIEIADGQVYLNSEPSRVFNRAHGHGADFGPLTLGVDEYFVLAEDRTHEDSRVWGPLDREELYGVAMFYFPEGSRSPFPVDPTAVPSPTAGRGRGVGARATAPPSPTAKGAALATPATGDR